MLTRIRSGLCLTALALSCCKPNEGKLAADGGVAEPAPRGITVRADRTDLVYSYRENSGPFKTASTIEAIPIAAREQVIVTDLSLSPAERQADRTIYIADLTKGRPDGTYPVAVASRYAFEAKMAGTSSTATGTEPGHEVIVYTTSWCGVCKKTKRFLDQLGVSYVERDVEASKRAAEELGRKASAHGMSPGGVPVIDVAGTLLQGLDETTLKTTLKERGFL